MFLLREAEKIICGVLFLGMTLLGFANVVVRYATDYSLAASEEMLTHGFLLLTVFGAAIAARRGEHLAVGVVHDLLPRALGIAMTLLAALLSVGLLAMSAYFSWEVLQNQLRTGVRSYALGLPAWYYQAAVPFGFALIIVRFLEHLWETLREGRGGGAGGGEGRRGGRPPRV